MSSVSSSICSTTSVEHALSLLDAHITLLLEDFDVRAQARHRCAQLVRGVRHQLALRVHGGVERPHRALQGVEHRVEALGESPDLVLARGLDPLGQILRASDVLGGPGETLDGRDGGARHEPSEQRRKRDPADVEQREDQAQALEQMVHVGERLGELHGVSRGAVPRRGCAGGSRLRARHGRTACPPSPRACVWPCVDRQR